jgi:SAM-dependent methyltransferase
VALRDNSDRSWEIWGEEDPYYGVLSDPMFRRDNLTEERRRQFFDTGVAHLAHLEALITRHFGGFAHRRAALDFGSGVGRVAIPLARAFDRVVGVDVSAAMRAEAERNCAAFGISNVRFLPSDDRLSAVTRRFDFIHSAIVLQHIPAERGAAIVSRLLQLLQPEGVIVLHFHYRRDIGAAHRAIGWLRRNFAPVHWAANVIQGRSWREPMMQMNVYEMGRILGLMQQRGITEAVTLLGAHHSAFLLARAPAD